ncbi:MAG: hypothetical protein K2K29_04880, partial [Muribaculaceae bacterium]|nr:hypothetical protein [Muribaculaceae bacterium]
MYAHPDGRRGPDEKKLKELRDYKIKYLAQEMELKEDQKAKFVELYEKMSEEKRKNFESMRSMERRLKKDATEAEYKELSTKISDCRIRDAQIDKEYDARFAEFLSQKQIYKMKEAEEKFHKKMMDMHHKRREERRKK